MDTTRTHAITDSRSKWQITKSQAFETKYYGHPVAVKYVSVVMGDPIM